MNPRSAVPWIVFACVALSPASGVAQQPARPPEIFGEIAGEFVRETPHFRIFVEKGFSPVDLDWLAAEVETIHAYLAERMGATAGERFSLTFRPPDTRPCPIRGLARWGPLSEAVVFADEKTSRVQVAGVLAHEIGHLFQFRALKVDGSETLNEGVASWAAGKYWEAWQKTSLADAVRAFKRDGTYLPLSDYLRTEVAERSSTGENCLKDREVRYTSWAAFIDFLVQRYGTEKLRQLLGPTQVPMIIAPQDVRTFILAADPRAPASAPLPLPPSPPPFNDVYGLSLIELEKAWLEELARGQ